MKVIAHMCPYSQLGTVSFFLFYFYLRLRSIDWVRNPTLNIRMFTVLYVCSITSLKAKLASIIKIVIRQNLGMITRAELLTRGNEKA